MGCVTMGCVIMDSMTVGCVIMGTLSNVGKASVSSPLKGEEDR